MINISVQVGRSPPVEVSLEAPIGIGRDASSLLCISDDAIAFEHAQIFREAGSYSFQDLGTAIPTRIHRGPEQLRTSGTKPVSLRDGDVLHLGDPARPVILTVHIADEEPVSIPTGRIQDKLAFDDFAQVVDDITRDTSTAKKLLEMTQKLARRGLDLASVFDGIADTVLDLMPKATHISIDLVEHGGGRGEWRNVYARSRDPKSARSGQPNTSRAVVRRILDERDAIIVADKDLSESMMGLQIQSTIGVPLWEGEVIRGVIQVDNRGASGLFLQRDLRLLVTVAGQAALAIENARLMARLRAAEEKARGENRYLKTREEQRRTPNMIGDSAAMQAIHRQIVKVKDTAATVCIEGETGTGKELIASTIHYQGSRREKLFVAQNCAAVPETLLESELFGHKKGAFTGAEQDKKGLFEIADGGSLFLDEIGEMSLGLQAKLLRVLQEREIRPVGATIPRPVDVRIICATNRSLEKEVERGAFRQDLYYRLKVFPLRLPPLRERREDIPDLVRHFLGKYMDEMKKPIAGITPEAMDQLAAHNWPGNIRELENEVQRFVIQADNDTFITPDLLAPAIRRTEELLGRIAPKEGTLKDRVEEVERWLLTEALRDHGGNKTRTAETLGITREGLHKKLSKYGM